MRGGRKPTVAGTKKKVDGWVRARHMRELFCAEVSEEEGLPQVRNRFQRRAWEKLQRSLLGKSRSSPTTMTGAGLPRAAPC